MTTSRISEEHPPPASMSKDISTEAFQSNGLYGYEAQMVGEEVVGDDATTTITTQRRYARRVNVTAEKAPFDISYHPRRILLYAPPRQRRKWGDSDTLPRINWGDLFFDLFYVAGTYNVSFILTDSPTWRGLLYTTGTFLPILAIWSQRTMFDARYVTEADIAHRLTNILVLCILGVAVLFIKSVSILSHPADDPSIMVFSLMLILERFVTIGQCLEVYWRGIGQKEIKPASSRDAGLYATVLPFYFAAFVVASSEFFGNDGSKRRTLAAAGTDYKPFNDIPIILIIFGVLAHIGIITTTIVCFFPPEGRHKEVAVPLNIDFLIHRHGDWITLMLGESVFSLLIVNGGHEGDYFQTVFFAGILTIILLRLLHFQSQPHGAEAHAARRDKNAGAIAHVIFHFYSLALVVLGAAFTLFLASSGQYDETRRQLETYSDDKAQAVVHLYGGALAVIFLSLDISSALHTGWKASIQRIPSEVYWLACVMYFLRLCLIVLVGTIGFWQTQTRKLALIGVFSVIAQLLMRKVDVTFLSGRANEKNQGHTMEKTVFASENILASADDQSANILPVDAAVVDDDANKNNL